MHTACGANPRPMCLWLCCLSFYFCECCDELQAGKDVEYYWSHTHFSPEFSIRPGAVSISVVPMTNLASSAASVHNQSAVQGGKCTTGSLCVLDFDSQHKHNMCSNVLHNSPAVWTCLHERFHKNRFKNFSRSTISHQTAPVPTGDHLGLLCTSFCFCFTCLWSHLHLVCVCVLLCTDRPV